MAKVNHKAGEADGFNMLEQTIEVVWHGSKPTDEGHEYITVQSCEDDCQDIKKLNKMVQDGGVGSIAFVGLLSAIAFTDDE